MATSENIVLTKHRNRNFAGKRSKTMSRQRYGILINHYDIQARKKDNPVSVSGTVASVKDLYYQFFDPLHYWGKPNGFGYVKTKDVIINPVGGLYSRRYFLSDIGKRRLKELKRYGKNKVRVCNFFN